MFEKIIVTTNHFDRELADIDHYTPEEMDKMPFRARSLADLILSQGGESVTVKYSVWSTTVEIVYNYPPF